MGAWIEIAKFAQAKAKMEVAPHMGAWIEIISVSPNIFCPKSRTPHGCVD